MPRLLALSGPSSAQDLPRAGRACPVRSSPSPLPRASLPACCSARAVHRQDCAMPRHAARPRCHASKGYGAATRGDARRGTRGDCGAATRDSWARPRDPGTQRCARELHSAFVQGGSLGLRTSSCGTSAKNVSYSSTGAVSGGLPFLDGFTRKNARGAMLSAAWMPESYADDGQLLVTCTAG